MKNQNLSHLVLGFLSSFLMACSSNPNLEGSLDSSSRVQDPGNSQSLAYCNKIKNGSLDIQAKAYTEGSGAVRYDLVILKIASLPSTFPQDTSYISFFRWKASSFTAPSLDSKALKFAIYNPETETYLTSWMSSARWQDLSSLAATLGASDPQSFFAQVHVIVNLADTAGEYDALKMVEYHYQTHKSQAEVDGLLPPFHADPAVYAVEADGSQRALALQGLHPFKDLKGQRSASEFTSMANAFCF